MTPGATAELDLTMGTGLLDRLIVRSDVASWRTGPPVLTGVAIGIPVGGLPVAIATHSADLALATVVPSLILLVWIVVVMARRIWCDTHPYLPARWVAAARATFGDELVDAALQDLRRRSTHEPARALRRPELILSIDDHRRLRVDARQAAKAVRASDIANGK